MSPESKKIKEAIKILLKQKKKKQTDLANFLDVSLATIKRLLNQEDIGIERLNKIAEFCSLNLFELFEYANDLELSHHTFTLDQEKYLCSDKKALLVFRGVVNKIPGTVLRKKYSLTKKNFYLILLNLEKVSLIELWENEHIKVIGKWPYRWIEKGPLHKKYFYKISELIFKKSYSYFETDTEFLFRPYEMAVSQKTYKEFEEDLLEILEKYKSKSKFDKATTPSAELIQLTGLITTNNFNVWELL